MTKQHENTLRFALNVGLGIALLPKLAFIIHLFVLVMSLLLVWNAGMILGWLIEKAWETGLIQKTLHNLFSRVSNWICPIQFELKAEISC